MSAVDPSVNTTNLARLTPGALAAYRVYADHYHRRALALGYDTVGHMIERLEQHKAAGNPLP